LEVGFVKLSTKGRYGVKALFDLASQQGAGPVSLKSIAERQGLSEHYLEQLAAPLRKAGLVSSVRGAQGGYVLGRPPEKITIGDILRVLEGPIGFSDEDAQGPNPSIADIVTQQVWDQVTKAIVEVVDQVTLADLLRRAEDEQARENVMFYI
jgi:Rrf2 family cysteine metabolism transcriptional repressor